MSLSTLFKNDRPCVHIGYAEGEHHICCAVDARQGFDSIHTEWLDKPKTNEELIAHADYVSTNYRIIRPLPYQAVWRKAIYLPLNCTPEQLDQKALEAIRENVPVPLSDIFFDYQIEKLPEKNAYKVALYALRRDYGNPLALDEETVLDCELNCFFRGYHYLNPSASQDFEQNRYYCKGVEFYITEDGFQITPKDTPDANHFTAEDISYPDHYVLKEKEAIVIAVGASLWDDGE